MHCEINGETRLIITITQPTRQKPAVRSNKIFMNSNERREARYQRRKAEREKRKAEKAEIYGDYNKVFTFEHLYAAYKECCKGVGWKASTQRYKANALLNVVNTLDAVRSGKFKSKGFFEFDIFERGKPRHIKSVHISERVVQRCLCDYSLVPTFGDCFIYDNGACMKGRGIIFAEERLVKHLKKYWHKYGNKGYALMFDFSKYFDNIDHEKLKAIIDGSYGDKRLASFIKRLVDDFGGEKGLGLGSQISQVSALRFASRLDHYVKEVLRIKGYGRYMDDGYMLHPDKGYLQKCLADLKTICECLGIKPNEKKTQIVKLSRGIPFLKHRFILTETSKVVILPAKANIVRERRKLKKFKQWYDEGKMTMVAIEQSYQSWRSSIMPCSKKKRIYGRNRPKVQCNAKRTLKNMDRLYRKLFYSKKEDVMENAEPVITIENICQACEKGPCESPCDIWYDCLEGKQIKLEDLQ